MKRIVTLITLWLVVCSGAQAQANDGSASPRGQASRAAVVPPMPLTEGEVERVDKERNEIVINHGDLPQLGMPAMTMAFSVTDKRMLERVKPGDKVRFNADIVKGEAAVTFIEVVR
jgi:Cu/Ag efflux protein CusF